MIPSSQSKNFKIPDLSFQKTNDINFHSINEQDIDFGLVTRVSNLIQSNTKLNIDNIEITNESTDIDTSGELKKFGEKLGKKIKEIEADTTGVLAFFRYLFRWSLKAEKTTLKEYLVHLKEFIDKIQPPFKNRLETIVSQQVQDKKEEVQAQDAQMAQDVAQTASAPGEASPPPVPGEIFAPPPPLAPENLFAPPQPPPAPENSFAPSPPPAPENEFAPPPPPPNPLDPLQQNAGPGGPPPPPPPVIVVQKFKGEPTEPAIKLPGTKGAVKVDKLTLQELETQIATIEKYVEKIKTALEPVELLVKEEETLDIYLKQDIADLAIINAKIRENEKKRDRLSENSDVVNLMLKVKDGEYKKTPYFSDERFDEINQVLEKGGLPKINDKFLQSKELEVTEETLKELYESKQDSEKTIKTRRAQLEEIRSNKNNNFPFAQFSKLLETKIAKKNTWERALTARKKQLAVISAPPKTEKPATEKPKSPAKQDLAAFLNSPSAVTLKQEFPELEHVGVLLSDQNALILLRGNDYHDKLVSEE